MWHEKLKQMKAESGLTTKEIAEQSGIPEPTLEKMFAGATKEPKFSTLMTLVYFFGHTLDELAGDIPIKKESPDAETTASRDSVETEFLKYLALLTDDQKKFLLAVLRTLHEQNQ